MTVELYRLKDLDLSGDTGQVFRKLMDKNVFEFLQKNVVLDEDTIVLNSDYALRLKITLRKYTSVLNLQAENNLNNVNDYIRIINVILKKKGKYFCCFEIRESPAPGDSTGLLGDILQKIRKKNGKYFTKEDVCEFFTIFDLHLITKKKINNLTYMVFEKREEAASSGNNAPENL